MEKQRHPVSGIDYPGAFQDFDRWFSSENACLEYVAKLRWPEGFTCPSCGEKADKPSLMGRGLFLCLKCKRQTSITAGTLFHGSHKPLRTWFLAMWFVTSQKHGASALGLKRVLGLGSYNTAGAKRKAIVAIAAEVRGRGPGRIRMAKIPDLSAPSLRRFVRDNVQRGAELRTDGWSGYNGIEVMGYKHTMTNISNSGDPAHVVMPRVHRVASLLDRWWLGIHQGAIRPSHLDYYLDEFTFRFNRRTSKARGLLFYRLMEQAVDCHPVPRKMIIGGSSQHVVYG